VTLHCGHPAPSAVLDDAGVAVCALCTAEAARPRRQGLDLDRIERWALLVAEGRDGHAKAPRPNSVLGVACRYVLELVAEVRRMRSR
jgi:hypothetical protein